MAQTSLNPELQAFVAEQLERQYPGAELETPMIIALPAGIGPYNRNPGYWDHHSNSIVAYQDWGRQLLAKGIHAACLKPFVTHELAHLYQYRILGYSKKSTVNAHRDKTWAEACFIATNNLWPELGLQRDVFSCWTSQRIEGKPVRSQRPGALTDTELHHWPWSLSDAVKRLQAEKLAA